MDEKQRFYLISAFEMLRAHDAKLNSVMTEIAAVRDALNEIGPKYNEILARHRQRNMEEIKPAVDDQLTRFDLLIQKLKES